jgi:hypothetical protein
MWDLMVDLGMLGIGLAMFAMTGFTLRLLDRLNRKGASR